MKSESAAPTHRSSHPPIWLILCGLLVGGWALGGSSAWVAAGELPEAEHAQEGTRSAQKTRYCIGEIAFIDLRRTKPSVIHTELAFAGVAVGQVVSAEEIENGAQKLRNLGVFREVLTDVVERPEAASGAGSAAPSGGECSEGNGAKLAIQFDEKWTALPLFSFSRGGGTYRLVLGAYDTNFLGRYINLGAQYERLGDTNSLYTWISPRRLLGRDLVPSLSLGSRNRLYRLYEPDGSVGGGFLLNRFSVTGSLLQRWREWLRTSVTLRYENDDFSLDLLSESVRQAQQARGVPAPSHALLFGANLTLGQLDRDSYLVDGLLFGVSASHANAYLGSSDSYRDLLVGLEYFRTLAFKSTLGFRFNSGFGSTDALHRRFYVGGLDALRGFASQRFSGNNYWLSTLEFRIPSVDTRWFMLQHIFFVDAAGVSETVDDLATLSGASAGLGLRIIVPKVQDFIIRIDYAFPLYEDVANPLGFGGGQFF